MSTLKVTNLRHSSASSDAITLASDGTATAKITSRAGRNVLVNGAMRVSQKGTSESSVTGSGYHLIDTYRFVPSSIGAWTLSQDSESPTQFSKSYKFDCTTAESMSGNNGSRLRLIIRLEGNTLQSFNKGTADAKPFAISFWTKTNKAGTYVVRLTDQDNSRHCSGSYTVSSGEASGQTWVKREIVLPADTTGAFDDDNAKSAELEFVFGAGSDMTSGTMSTSWAATSDATSCGSQNVNLGDSTDNVFYLTGIQLETDRVTDYEHRSYADELFRCMRYYQQHVRCGASNAKSTSQVDFNPILYPDMRAAPTVGQTGVISMNGDNADKTQGSTGLNVYGSDTTSAFVRLENFSSLTAWRTYLMKFGNSNVLTYTSEL